MIIMKGKNKILVGSLRCRACNSLLGDSDIDTCEECSSLIQEDIDEYFEDLNEIVDYSL